MEAGPWAGRGGTPMTAENDWLSFRDAPKIRDPPAGTPVPQDARGPGEARERGGLLSPAFPHRDRRGPGRHGRRCRRKPVHRLGGRDPRTEPGPPPSTPGGGPRAPGGQDLAFARAPHGGAARVPRHPLRNASRPDEEPLANDLHRDRRRRGRDGGEHRRARHRSARGGGVLRGVPRGPRRRGEPHQRPPVPSDHRLPWRDDDPGPVPRPVPARARR